jgi:hypothetical protein
MTGKPETFEADLEAARAEAVALYGEEVVVAAEAAFDESCFVEVALGQAERQQADRPPSGVRHA